MMVLQQLYEHYYNSSSIGKRVRYATKMVMLVLVVAGTVIVKVIIFVTGLALLILHTDDTNTNSHGNRKKPALERVLCLFFVVESFNMWVYGCSIYVCIYI